mmetsp:Transcript_1572/g.4656  ORF Transcript_1572/g.4656 Transcript_1572/m.4656 type:complete len:216 (-) Transcript_1572:484-1131(-)
MWRWSHLLGYVGSATLSNNPLTGSGAPGRPFSTVNPQRWKAGRPPPAGKAPFRQGPCRCHLGGLLPVTTAAAAAAASGCNASYSILNRARRADTLNRSAVSSSASGDLLKAGNHLALRTPRICSKSAARRSASTPLSSASPTRNVVFMPSSRNTSHTRSRWSNGSAYAKAVMNQWLQYMEGCTPSAAKCAPSAGSSSATSLSNWKRDCCRRGRPG